MISQVEHRSSANQMKKEWKAQFVHIQPDKEEKQKMNKEQRMGNTICSYPTRQRTKAENSNKK